jgi:predicted nucleic acid-binding protein
VSVGLIVVVSDTSPLRALYYLRELELLERFYGSVLIPPAVERELAFPRKSTQSIDVTSIGFITVQTPTDTAEVRRLARTLDAGEAEAISLAKEVGADLLLIDEARGRAAADAAGLPHVGLLGILIRAKHEQLIADVRSRLDRLRAETRFFISEQLYQHVLRQLGE